MSLVPSDSVSQQGVSNTGVGQPVLSTCPVMCVPPVYPDQELLSLVGPTAYAQRLASYDRQMELYYKYAGSYLAAYQSYCRVSAQGVAAGSSVASSSGSLGASSVGSRVSPGGSPVTSTVSSSSFTGCRVGKAAIRKLAKTMRSRGVTSALPGGYCYARLIRPEARESSALALGSYPAIGDLLARPREEFLPLTATSDVTVLLRSNGVAHVDYLSRAGGVDAHSFNDAVLALARRSEFSYGTYGHALRVSASASLEDPLAGALNLDTPVGADTPPPPSYRRLDSGVVSSGYAGLMQFVTGRDASLFRGSVVRPWPLNIYDYRVVVASAGGFAAAFAVHKASRRVLGFLPVSYPVGESKVFDVVKGAASEFTRNAHWYFVDEFDRSVASSECQELPLWSSRKFVFSSSQWSVSTGDSYPEFISRYGLPS